MGDIIVTITIVSKRTGGQKTEKFPLDEGMYRAIKTLPVQTQIDYFTQEYRAYKKIENLASREAVSIDSEDDELGFSHDVPDPGMTPSEFASFCDDRAFLYALIQSLKPKERLAISEVFFRGKKQRTVAKELGLTEGALSICLKKSLAKLRDALSKRF
jgi:RNA polymerase sigma factor (sigma-70 family)